MSQNSHYTDKKEKGKLKIFFGACAGVGKTYDMLSAAQEKLREGVDVVAGIIETHGRVETGKLLEGVPKLALKQLNYQGITLTEFDLDEAIKRKPAILLIDELAHSNIKGLRHPKRWQDIQEILEAGIDVYTTLNVQHLESLNDTIASMTGIQVKETVPDSVFDEADEIVLVDIPSEIILERLREGKVYMGEFTKQRAAQHFFKIENLIVLRELALRRTAERVDALRDEYQKYQRDRHSSSLSDRIVVCIGPKPLSAKLVRTAKQQASKLKCPWVALYVENDAHYTLTNEEKASVEKTFRLAEQLGGQTVVLQASNTPHAILAYIQKNHVTRLIIGKHRKTSWWSRFSRSLANQIIDESETVDIFIVNDDDALPHVVKRTFQSPPWLAYLLTFVVVTLCTIIAFPIKTILEPENVVMIYLAGLVFIATIEDRSTTLLAALLSVIFYNMFFTHPYYGTGLSPYFTREVITLFIFLLVGGVITTLTAQLRLRSLSAQQREKYLSTLYDLSRQLLITSGKYKIAKVISHSIGETFDCAVTVWLPDSTGMLELASHPGIKAELKEESVAQWSFSHHQAAGLGTNTMPSARGYYLPLSHQDTVYGVLGLVPQDPKRQFTIEDNMMLEALALQASLALERQKEKKK